MVGGLKSLQSSVSSPYDDSHMGNLDSESDTVLGAPLYRSRASALQSAPWTMDFVMGP